MDSPPSSPQSPPQPIPHDRYSRLCDCLNCEDARSCMGEELHKTFLDALQLHNLVFGEEEDEEERSVDEEDEDSCSLEEEDEEGCSVEEEDEEGPSWKKFLTQAKIQSRFSIPLNERIDVEGVEALNDLHVCAAEAIEGFQGSMISLAFDVGEDDPEVTKEIVLNAQNFAATIKQEMKRLDKYAGVETSGASDPEFPLIFETMLEEIFEETTRVRGKRWDLADGEYLMLAQWLGYQEEEIRKWFEIKRSDVASGNRTFINLKEKYDTDDSDEYSDSNDDDSDGKDGWRQFPFEEMRWRIEDAHLDT